MTLKLFLRSPRQARKIDDQMFSVPMSQIEEFCVIVKQQRSSSSWWCDRNESKKRWGNWIQRCPRLFRIVTESPGLAYGLKRIQHNTQIFVLYILSTVYTVRYVRNERTCVPSHSVHAYVRVQCSVSTLLERVHISMKYKPLWLEILSNSEI